MRVGPTVRTSGTTGRRCLRPNSALVERAEKLVGSRSAARFQAKPTSTAGPMNTIAVRRSVWRKKNLRARERREAHAPVT